MTTKQRCLEIVQELPDDASIDEVMERLLFVAKVERGVREAEAGLSLSHDEVRARMAKWLK